MNKYFCHETSTIDKPTNIGDNTKIWHYSHIMKNANIGKHCIIGQNVYISDGVIIGNRVKIQNNVSIYKGVTCEDDVFVGPSVVFTNVINPRSFVERKNEFKKTLVKKGCSIGANSTIICGTILGEFSLVGAGSVVTKNVNKFEIVIGNPSRHLGWISKNGDRLKFDYNNIAVCKISNQKYKLNNNQVELYE